MIKKSIFIVLAIFGFNSFAEMHEVDHMSDMVSEAGVDEDSGFAGSVWLKYKHGGQPTNFSYRAHLGWSGDVNEAIRWGVGLRSNWEEKLTGPRLPNTVYLEKMYVSFSPVEGFSITAGKRSWKADFHKKGVLYDERLNPAGVFVKYKQDAGDDADFYVKAAFYELDNSVSAPLAGGSTLKGKIGGNFAVAEGMSAGVYVAAIYDGLLKDERATAAASTGIDDKSGESKNNTGKQGNENTATASSSSSSSGDAKALAQVGVHFSSSSMAVPVGAFGIYVTDAQNIGDNHSFTAGFHVGNAGSAVSGDAGDFGVAVSYYDIKTGDHTTRLMHGDYVLAPTTLDVIVPKDLDFKGVAVRAQYNVWDNTNAVVKYARNLGEKQDGVDQNAIVGELTFHF